MFLLSAANKNIKVSNVALEATGINKGFIIRGASGCNLHIINTYLFSKRENISVDSSTTKPQVSVTNSLFVNGDVTVAAQYPNLNTSDNFSGTAPATAFFSGVYNFQNVKFVCRFAEGHGGKGHIISDNLESNKGGIYVILNSCTFWASRKADIAIWGETQYDSAAGKNMLEIVGSTLSNSSMLYYDWGTDPMVATLTIYGYQATGIFTAPDGSVNQIEPTY